MKNILIAAIVLVAVSCGSKAERSSNMDSMSSMDNTGIMDTVVTPNPDGYAPPNADIDTSQYRKDSINARDSINKLKQ